MTFKYSAIINSHVQTDAQKSEEANELCATFQTGVFTKCVGENNSFFLEK